MKKILPLLVLLSGLAAAADETIASVELVTPLRTVREAPRGRAAFKMPNYSCFSPRPATAGIGGINLRTPGFWDHGSPFLYWILFKDEQGRVVARRRMGLQTLDITRRGLYFNGRPERFPSLSGEVVKRVVKPAPVCGVWDSATAFAPVLTSRKVALYDSAKRLDPNRKDDTARMLARYGIPFTAIENFEGLEEFDVLIIGADSFDYAVTENGKTIRSFVEGGKRLLSFRQGGDGRYPFLPELRRVGLGAGNYCPEIVQPGHPVFEELRRLPLEAHYDSMIAPLSPAVLLAGENRSATSFGMLSAHLKLGKGDMILSQGDEPRYYEKDRESAFYTRQMLETILDERSREYAKEFYSAPLGRIRKMNHAKAVFIPLGDAADWDTVDEVAGDKKGGYADQGKENDLQLLPLGKQNFRGFLFEVSEEPGKRISIVCTNPQRPFRSESAEIPVGDNFKRLYFCHTGAWMARAGTTVAEYVVTYDSGKIEKIPVISGWNIADWWNGPSAKLEDGECIWQIRNVRNVLIGAFGFMWSNPLPEEKIQSIRLVSKTHTVVGLIGITGEK